jgi:hypothetical protein
LAAPTRPAISPLKTIPSHLTIKSTERNEAMHFSVGDIVQRVDIKGRKKFVIERIANDGSGWIYARPIGGGSIVTFVSQYMLKKVG